MGAATGKPMTESAGIKNTYSPKRTIIVLWKAAIRINSHLERVEVINVEGHLEG